MSSASHFKCDNGKIPYVHMAYDSSCERGGGKVDKVVRRKGTRCMKYAGIYSGAC